MRFHNVLAQDMVSIQLQPSLSSADGHQLPSGRTSAFVLQPFAKSGVVVGSGSHFLPAIKLGTVGGRGHGRQVALPHVHPYDQVNLVGRGVWPLNFQCNQQIEALLAPVIPEFSGTDRGSIGNENPRPFL
jgi:hypothetical protein